MNSFFGKYRWILILVASGAAIALAIYARPKPEPVVVVVQETVSEESAVEEVEAEVSEEDELAIVVDDTETDEVTETDSTASQMDDVQTLNEEETSTPEHLAEETTDADVDASVTEADVSEPASTPAEEVASDPAPSVEPENAEEQSEDASVDTIENDAADETVAASDAPAVAEEASAPEEETVAIAEEASPVVEGAAAALSVASAEETADGVKPSFDIVRVDSSGSAVIAGSAEPSSKVVILSNGEQIGEATADGSGEFVAIIQVPNSEQGQTLELESEVGGELLFSDETILILPTFSSAAAEAVSEETPPAIIRATEDEVVIVQGATQLALGQVSLDSISYDADEEVVLAGRGNPGRRVIIYVDDKPLMDTVVSESGSWKQALHGLDAGRYVLRVDEIDDAGTVTSRVESPFQREYPEDVREAKSNTSPTYTVQPGNSLWVIATGRYGDGLKYHQIFTANQDQIRDPDLIYPGQVFALPNSEE